MGQLENLWAYTKAFELAMEIFEISRKFPKEEKYSLTDQVRRSSRSVCANLGEAYRRRKYRPHFLSKLADADAENTETGVWLEFALACQYLTKDERHGLIAKKQEVGKLIGDIINNPAKYL